LPAAITVFLTLLVVACGGGGPSGPVGPGNGDAPRPGLISVDNQTPFDVEVAFLQRLEGEASIVRHVVAAGTRATVVDSPLAAGTELELDLVLLVPPEQGLRVRRKAAVIVDGDSEVVLTLTDSADPFSLTVGGTSTEEPSP
jgi:hypothetical protein